MVLFWRTADVYSNWHPSPFIEDGVSFANAEQYLMWRKAKLFGDEEMAARMLATTNPKTLKDLGRKVKGYDEAMWERARLSVMVQGCLHKFGQSPLLKATLLGTGQKLLVEASPYDKIWGIGLEEEDPRCLDTARWQGRNLLGEALMTARELLREMEAFNVRGAPKEAA